MRFVFVDQSTENFGVEILSSVLKQAGHEVYASIDIVAQSGPELNKIDPRKITTAVEDILIYQPDVVGFSCFTDSFRFLRAVAQDLRKRSNVPTVFGGVHATLCAEDLIKYNEVDYVIVGEGEEALPLLVNAIENKQGISQVPNLIYKENGHIFKNPLISYVRDLDRLQFPDKELYANLNPYIRENYYALTSRGCPFGCTFCSNNAYHRIYSFEKNHLRRRSPENVIQELEIAKEIYGTKSIFFADDMFSSDINWLEEFTELFNKRVHLPYYCASHPFMINGKVVEMLKDSGCYHLEIGFQTPIDKIRKDMLGRNETRENLEEVASLCRKYNLSFSVDHMFGLPGEDKSQEQEILFFYNRLKPKKIDKYWLNFYPGTDIIDQAVKHCLIEKKDVEKINSGEFAFDYMSGGYLRRFPEKWKRTLKIALFMEIMLFFPKIIANFLISIKLYLIMPGNPRVYRWSKIIRAYLRGSPRVKDFVEHYLIHGSK